jgi:hypothetical protein
MRRYSCEKCHAIVDVHRRAMHAPVCPDVDCRGALELAEWACPICGGYFEQTTPPAVHCPRCRGSLK